MTQKKTYPYPDDGGLKEPVRSFADSGSAFIVMIKHFFRK